MNYETEAQRQIDNEANEAARRDWLINHFRELMFERQYDEIDEYVSDCERLAGEPVYDWLRSQSRKQDWADFQNNVNPITNAHELMSDYVDMLIEYGEYPKSLRGV